ncbi:MAG TPA: hypothetical protein VGO03_13975 [Acidimicrobiia bacterium]
MSRFVAAALDRSVVVDTDAFLGSIVRGWVDPNRPEASQQHEAVGAAFAVSAITFAAHGYAAVVDGYVFPDGAHGLATACAARNLACHYVVLAAYRAGALVVS